MDRAAGPGDAIVPERAVGAGAGKPAAAVLPESGHGGNFKTIAHTGTLKSVQVETPAAKPAGAEQGIVETAVADVS